jgi:hypothetical protein
MVADPKVIEISPVGSAPANKFYSVQSIAIAAFFGTSLAGALLMAVNYRHLGQTGKAALTVTLGLLASLVVVTLAYVAPSKVASSVALAFLLSLRMIANKVQGPTIARHVAQGGKLVSGWKALGVGLAGSCLVFVAVFVPSYLGAQKSKVIIGTKDEVYYTGQATKEDAQKLGDFLKSEGYFKDRGTSVFLDKDKDGPTVSLVLKEGLWNDPETLDEEEQVVREVAPVVGGFPVRFKLLDSSEDVKKQGVVGREAVGNDEVFYMGAATEAEAKALGASLVKMEYLSGRGASVLLTKNDTTTVISFVVGDGFWNDPEHVASFEKIVRDVAPTVGGLPVTLRLVNTTLDTKKEVVVK